VGARKPRRDPERPAIGRVTDLTYNATINRDGIGGYWKEHDLEFDASLMKAGGNQLKLNHPRRWPGPRLIYDYLRLELDKPPSHPGRCP